MLEAVALAEADSGHLGVAEDCVRNEAVVDVHRRVGVDEVVGHDLRFVVGDVLQLDGIRDVAQRPDPVDVRPKLAVGDDVAVVVDRHPRRGNVELVGVRDAAGGDEQRIASQLEAFALGRDDEDDLVTFLSCFVDLASEPHVVLPAVDLGEPMADRVVLVAEETIATEHEGHVRAEGAEAVAEFGGDVSTAENQQPFGRLLDPHDGVGRVVVDMEQAGDVGDEAARARGEDELVAEDDLVADLELFVTDEAGVVLEDGDVAEALAVVFAALGDGIDPAEHPIPDGRPIGAVALGVHTQLGPLPFGEFSDLGRVHEHLRGDASDVETGPSEEAALHDGDVQVVVFGPDDRVSRAGTDDDEVEGLHSGRLPVALARQG